PSARRTARYSAHSVRSIRFFPRCEQRAVSLNSANTSKSSSWPRRTLKQYWPGDAKASALRQDAQSPHNRYVVVRFILLKIAYKIAPQAKATQPAIACFLLTPVSSQSEVTAASTGTIGPPGTLKVRVAFGIFRISTGTAIQVVAQKIRRAMALTITSSAKLPYSARAHAATANTITAMCGVR